MFDATSLNPIERAILKRVTKYMSESGVKYVGIYLDNDNNPQFEVFTEPVKVLTLTQAKELLTQLKTDNDKDSNAGKTDANKKRLSR
jgi:hypothetical protein